LVPRTVRIAASRSRSCTSARIASPARIPVTANKPISVWNVTALNAGTRVAAPYTTPDAPEVRKAIEAVLTR